MLRYLLAALLLTACAGQGSTATAMPPQSLHKQSQILIKVYDDLTAVNYFNAPFVGCIPGEAFFVPSGFLTKTETDIGGFLPYCLSFSNVPAAFRIHDKRLPAKDFAALRVGTQLLQRDTCQLDMFYVSPTKAFFTRDEAWGQGISCYVVQLGDLKAEMVVEPPYAPPPKPGHPFQ